MSPADTDVLLEIGRTRASSALQRKGYALVALHRYESVGGDMIYVKARFEGAHGKEVRPFVQTPAGWRCAGPDLSPMPLFRLPKLHAAPSDATVWFVEGETCVEALEDLGVLATTAGGANSDAKTDLSPLFGKHVVIWPDNDESGRNHAQRVGATLRSGGCTVSFVEVDQLELPPKGDVVDWLARCSNAAPASLEALARRDEIFDAPPELESVIRPASASSVSASTSSVDVRVQEIHVGRRTYTSWKHKGLWVDEEADDGGQPSAPARRVAGPIRVVAQVRDRDSDGWSVLVVWTNKDGLSRRIVIPIADFLDVRRGYLKRLLDGGLELVGGAVSRKLLTEFLEEARPEERALLARQMGWCQGVFVADELGFCKAAGGESVFLARTPPVDWMSSAGSLDDWKEHVGAKVARHSRLVLAISLAFAGPLLDVVNEPSGCVHFYGASSTGKSTALAIGASVYGAPDTMRRSWRATANALEAVAALHNDSALFLDELHEIDPTELYKAAYMLGNGQGKSRSQAEGGLRETLRWRVAILSSGEVRADHYISSSGRTANAGQSVRIVDVPLPRAGRGIFDATLEDDSPALLADALNSASSRFFGVAGEHWLRTLSERRVADPEGLTGQLSKRRDVVMESWLAGRTLEPVQRRVAKKFALIGVAGELATESGLTGWPPGRATECARVCFDAWVSEAEARGEREKRQILDRFEQLIARHGASRFERADGSSDEARCPDRLGWMRLGASGVEEYLMPCAVFDAELAAGAPIELVRETLTRAGALVRPTGGGWTHRVRFGKAGQHRVYVLRCPER